MSGTNMYYKRNFIILNEFDKGYGIDRSTSATGHIKIEVKRNIGRLTHYIQKLKPVDIKYVFRGYIIGEKRSDLIKIDTGIIELSENGKGEMDWDFNPANIKGTGLTIDELKVIVIACCSLEEHMTIRGYPLVGYVDKTTEIEWKDAFNKKMRQRDIFDRSKREELTEKSLYEVEAQDKDFSDNENDITQNEIEEPEDIDYSSKELEQNIDNIDNDFVDFNSITDFLDAQNLNYEEHEGNIPDGLEDKRVDEQDFSSYSRYWDTVEYFFESVFRGYKEIQPFESRLEGHDWRKIWVAYTDFCNMYRYIPIYYYTYNYNLEKYKHYLIGLVYEEQSIKYIVYGLPGRLLKEEQPYSGMTGYMYWQPIRGQEKREGEHGYWLMYIDADTGQIIKPYGETNIG